MSRLIDADEFWEQFCKAEIIHCRDCKFSTYIEDEILLYCDYHDNWWSDDDFCSLAERRME